MLYWQASEAELGRAPDAKPASTYKTSPGSSPQTSPASFNPDIDSAMKSESSPSPARRPPTTHDLDTDNDNNNNNNSRCPIFKKPFAYYPHLIFLGLLGQIAFFFAQFDIYRRNGLPGFVARWPVIYALTAPSTTGMYMIGVVRLASARWPALRTWNFVELGESCVWAGWVVWSLGVWWVVRGW